MAYAVKGGVDRVGRLERAGGLEFTVGIQMIEGFLKAKRNCLREMFLRRQYEFKTGAL
jgi:hypothetical protein